MPELFIVKGSPYDSSYDFDEAIYYYKDEFEGYEMLTEYQFGRHIVLLTLDRINYSIQIDNPQESLTLMEKIYNEFEPVFSEKGNCYKTEIYESIPGEYYGFLQTNPHISCGILSMSFCYKDNEIKITIYYD